jgi:3'-phosphoadenosine 5'-phosphosulfate sulfotransferase (PAPS reductase)/FAD synthetase
MMNILSLGAGVQSSTVLLMSCRGILPKLDGAIFADTGWEPKRVHTWLDTVLEPEAAKAGIPIHRCNAGNIKDDALRSSVGDGKRWAAMPFYTSIDGSKEGLLRRQCTNEYKIEPVQKMLKTLNKGKKGARIMLWFGISGDETRRMRMSKVHWIEHYYPLVFGFERPMTRLNCQAWLKEQGFSESPRSACIGCPYRDAKSWREMRDSAPDEWNEAVEFDAAIRQMKNKTTHELYLHRSCQPLPMVDLETLEEKGQQNWLNECEGMCGV